MANNPPAAISQIAAAAGAGPSPEDHEGTRTRHDTTQQTTLVSLCFNDSPSIHNGPHINDEEVMSRGESALTKTNQ